MKIGILWDLDGTLLDTLDDLTDAVNHGLAQFGYPLRTRDEVRRFVGSGARRLIQRAIPEGADPDPVQSAFWNYYAAHCQDKTRPFEGIMQALAQLNRYPMAIVSNKPDAAVKTLCRQYFPDLYAMGMSDAHPRKPEPDMVLKAMADIGVDTCIYVGDSEVDVITAKNANVPCLSVLWGFRDKQTLIQAGADHFCSEPSQLPQALDSIAATL
jgi:phosphoglycolate phosphatase